MAASHRDHIARALSRISPTSFIRSIEPYSTHVPLLEALGDSMNVNRVVEFGSGIHSTSVFLDRGIFPHLVQLDSYENDRTWLQQVVEMTDGEQRLALHEVDGPISSIVEPSMLDDVDLILIDDDIRAEQRARTIQAVAEASPPQALVLIHDFEVPLYQQASRAFRKRLVFKALRPFTAVCWKMNSPPTATLKQTMRCAAKQAKKRRLAELRRQEEHPHQKA